MLHAASPEELGYTAARGGTGGPRGTLGGGFAVEHDCFARPVRAAGFPSASALRARLLAMPQLVCSAEGALCYIVDGQRYARAGDVQCAAWRFAAGATFTLTTLIHATPAHQPIDVPPAYMNGYRQIHLFFDLFYASDDGQAHMSYDRYSASAESLLDRDVHACVQLAREAVVPAAPPTLPPPPPSLLYRRRIGSRRSQGTLSSALLPCAPPAWLASCCCVQWGVAEEACGVEGQLPKGVKVVSTAHNVVFMNVTCQAPH